MDLYRVGHPWSNDYDTVSQPLGKVREPQSRSFRDIGQMEAITELVTDQHGVSLL